MYDIAIIGAGINGSALSYELTNAGKKVLVLDMNSIAGGGSGAAGAFISPKFSKTGELKELLHNAFEYSLDFYTKNFPQTLTKVPLLHIAQDEESSKILNSYKKSTALNLTEPSKELLNKITQSAKEEENISLDAGVVNAEALCKALCKSANFIKYEVKSLVYKDATWVIDEIYFAKEVILATGAYEKIIKEPYINLRGIWGHRVDVKTTTQNTSSIHQFVSISPSKDNILAIGATHNVHYHPQTAIEPYNLEKGREELLEKASRTIELENVEVIKDYTGLRSGTSDYMPLIGRVVMSDETLKCENVRYIIERSKYKEYRYYPNLYMINGSGGYGFVLAPYLAKMLSELILSEKDISYRMSPARFFTRWAKKKIQ